ncbi:glycosyltransferase family 2 protein [Flavobacterium sp.]|jgi:glycosyltransferase involved in cell wall biosynthesis|uniref:glycosyltransferase family 2 protein n=1 Tax=Flavobacterium sp. TaxID=239 RepID=UPI00391B1EA1
MIILYHNQSKITEIVSSEINDFPNEIGKNVVTVLLDFAEKFQNEILVWCHENYKENLNINGIDSFFHHKKFLFTFNPTSTNYFNRELGYIEDSPFVKVNKAIRYGTWQMSSQVGAIHSSIINACRKDLKSETNFDYFLNSFAKRAMAIGLLCYSEPKLLLKIIQISHYKNTNLFELFRFTKQHYKTRWIFLLFFNLFLFEKRFPLFPFLFSIFYKKRTINPDKLNQIEINSTKKIIEKGTIDVLIPTIGRKEYLLDVLQNLASQTYLPTTVIIIEQNPNENSSSELDYIENTTWPFQIKHHFTQQAGVCNARNIGLNFIESEFCFLADDDITFNNDLLEKVMQNFQSTGNEVLLVSCHLKTQSIIQQQPKQFPIFGGGHAFVKSSCLKGLKFDMAYEFGFGEDGDFGMQLLNKGYDILFISTFEIIHLKAPIGGFRTKPFLKWSNEQITPKPSPTVMLYKLKHDTKEQLSLYKVTLFLKNINGNFLKNPYHYIAVFKSKWNKSVFWANKLYNE